MLRVATLSALAVAAAKEHLCVPWTRAQRSALERSNAFLPEPATFAAEAPRDADADALHALLRSLGEACADPFLPVGGTNALGSHLNALVLPLRYAVASNRTMLTPPLGAYANGSCASLACYFLPTAPKCDHSHSAGRAGRAWFCGFEILMFLYSVAFHTNLVFPDVEDQCAAYPTYTKCLGLKTYLRGKMDFDRWHLEPADLCEWDMCSQACLMAEPVIGDMSVTYYFILAVMFIVLLPVVKIFEFMAEGYLMAPVPPAIAELCCCVAEHVEDHWTRAPAQAYMKHTNTKRELLKAQVTPTPNP